jgi:uncharacterized protein
VTAPLPEPTPVSQPFWDALREHRILIQYSPSANRYVFYPRTLVPGTLADDLVWREIDGAGTLYTYTVARRPTGPPWAEKLPQLLAVVEWDAGPRVSTELVDIEPGHSHRYARLPGLLRRSRNHVAAVQAGRCLKRCSSCFGRGWPTTPWR